MQGSTTVNKQLTRQDFDDDMLIAEQEAYALAQLDCETGTPHRGVKMPTPWLEAAYFAGWDDWDNTA